MEYLRYCIIIVFIFFSCQRQNSEIKVSDDQTVKHEDSFKIDVELALKDAKFGKLPFSMLGHQVEYIPLETIPASLFGGGVHGIEVQVVSDKVIMFDMKRFDRKTGRYLGDLMKKGQGPQEYLWVRPSAVDDEREEFYLCDLMKNRTYVVGYDGIFKKSLPSGHLTQLLNLGNGNLLFARGNSLEETYDNFYIKNVDTEEVLLRQRSSALMNIKSLDECKGIFLGNQAFAMGENIYWSYNGEGRYYDYLTDSVYSISNNLEVAPIGSILMGNLKITREQFAVGATKRNFFVWNLSGVTETADNLFLNVFASKPKGSEQSKKEGMYFIIVYSKKDKSIQTYQLLPADESLYANMYLNDLDNTISFYPNPILGALSFYGLIPVERIKERAAGVFSEQEMSFKKMADSLKFDDNEVIGIIK